MWPNGWMDQHKTWHAGRPRSWPHCVRWGPSSPLKAHSSDSPQFSAHICCGQMAGSIKMLLDMEVGLGPGDFVLDGDPAPSQKGGRASPMFGPCLLWPNGLLDQDGTCQGIRIPLAMEVCLSSPPLKGHSPLQFSANVRCGQTARSTKMPFDTKVGLDPGDFVFVRTQLPPEKRYSPQPIFGPCLL